MRVNAANARQAIGDLAGAGEAADEAVLLARELGEPAVLVPALLNRGMVRQQVQRFAEAVADYTEAAETAAQAGDLSSAGVAGNQGIQLAYGIGDSLRAERLWTVLATVARASGDQAGLQRALGEGALLLINRAQPAGVAPDPTAVDQALLAQAATMLDEQEAICRATGDLVALAQCVGNRAIVLRHAGDLNGSLSCLDEQLALAQQSGNVQGVLFATANRGEVLGLLGRVPEALQALGWARQTAAQYGLAPMAQQLDAMIAGLQQRG